MGGAWIICGLGLLGLVSSIPAFWQTQRARSYRPVSGRIIERSIVRAPWFRVTDGWGSYTVRAKYVYNVDGTEFTSERFALVPHRYGRKKAEAELANLPEYLTVFVNPRNPADAVVNRQGTAAVIGTFCLSAVAVLYAVVSIAYR